MNAMYTPTIAPRRLQPDLNQPSHASAADAATDLTRGPTQGQDHADTAAPKVSLRQVRDQSYGAEPVSRNKHENNVVALYDSICREGEELLRLGEDDIARRISERIGDLAQEAGLDLAAYQARGAGAAEYGKFLLASSRSLDNPLLRDRQFCVQLLCFDAGQATSIHNHACECASVVLQGEVREVVYQVTCPGLVKRTSEHVRRAGERSELDVMGENPPHRLENGHNGRSVTLQVYAMDGMSEKQASSIKDIFVLAENS